MFKTFFLFFIFSTFFFSAKPQSFIIKTDTINLNVKNIICPASKISLTHAIKADKLYYCFFKEINLYQNLRKKHFLIISSTGKIIKNVKIPNRINHSIYFDFFKKDDRILFKDYHSQDCFTFDKNSLKWHQTDKIDDEIYEDNQFSIKYRNHGEWGASTWFIDKKTKKEYISAGLGTTINYFNNNYFFTNENNILYVRNPEKLKKCNKKELYSNSKRIGEGSNSMKGVTRFFTAFASSNWFQENSTNQIKTSFTSKNQLFHIYSDSIKTYITKVRDKKLVPVQSFKKKFQIYENYYSFRGKNSNNNKRFLKFKENDTLSGFIEINDDKININYLKYRIDTLKYSQNKNLKNILKQYIFDFNNLSLNKVQQNEKMINSSLLCNENIPTNFKGKKYYPIEYILPEDRYITQVSRYYQNKENFKIDFIQIAWKTTQLYYRRNPFYYELNNNKNFVISYKKKSEEIKKLLSQLIGYSPKKNDQFRVSWNLENGLYISIYNAPGLIALNIYPKK